MPDPTPEVPPVTGNVEDLIHQFSNLAEGQICASAAIEGDKVVLRFPVAIGSWSLSKAQCLGLVRMLTILVPRLPDPPAVEHKPA